MPAMRWIAKRAEIGVVRRDDRDMAAGHEQPMDLFERADHVGHVLDQMNGADVAERAITKRVGKLVQIGEYIGARMPVAIDADRPRKFVDSAAYIEHRQYGHRLDRRFDAYRSNDCRHCSSVSSAKSA